MVEVRGSESGRPRLATRPLGWAVSSSVEREAPQDACCSEVRHGHAGKGLLTPTVVKFRPKSHAEVTVLSTWTYILPSVVFTISG